MVAGPLLAIARSAVAELAPIVVVTVALLLALSGSLRPAGAAMEAVLLTVPDDGAVPVTV